jgi:hypothetical protein
MFIDYLKLEQSGFKVEMRDSGLYITPKEGGYKSFQMAVDFVSKFEYIDTPTAELLASALMRDIEAKQIMEIIKSS